MKKLILAVTGASGGTLAKRALEFLADRDDTETHIVFSENGEKVYDYEVHGKRTVNAYDSNTFNAGKSLRDVSGSGGSLRDDIARWISLGARFRVYANDDLFAPIASGSFPADGMIIIPCSMSTAAKIAAGTDGNLLCRAASVCIKERVPLVTVPRESPLSAIHLQNLLTLSQNGVYIMPPVPAFYDKREDYGGVLDGIVGRALKTAGIENRLFNQFNP